MFSKTIEEFKEKEAKLQEEVAILEETVKDRKSQLLALTKARKQLEKMQDQFSAPETVMPEDE